MVPAGTPDDVLEKIDVAFQNILGRPEIKEYLANTNTDLLGLTGEAADEMAARQERVHSWVLYDLGLVTISPEDFGIERP
jgi:tripartite-type tricarboxylate transporter receptor subunit TctC